MSSDLQFRFANLATLNLYQRGWLRTCAIKGCHLRTDYPNMDWLNIFKGKKIGVVGKIAAGKTTLVENMERFFREHGVAVFAETEGVNEQLLKLYCDNPARWAEVFQQERLDSCWMRQDNINKKREAFGPADAVGIVERPMYENRLFANANRRMGWLGADYLEEFYEPHMADRNNFPCDLHIYLHRTNKESKQSQDERGREGEEQYTDQYLAVLGDEYFNFVSDHTAAGDLVVMDWSNWGDTEEVLRLAAEVLAKTKPLPRVVRLDTSSDEELTSSAGVLRIHGDENEYQLDQAPEKNLGPQNRAFRALAEFRDIELTVVS